MYWVTDVLSEGMPNPKQEKTLKEATIIFVCTIIIMLSNKIVDTYLHMHDVKQL